MYKYENAIDTLINNFPELKTVYEKDKYDYEGLPYGFYETEFTDVYIMDKVRKNGMTVLTKIFDFVEDMFVNGDEDVKMLIGVTVVESLYFEKEFMDRFQSFTPLFGAMTKESFDDCINYVKMTTLREKYGFQPDTSGFGSGLVEWYNEVIEKELGELDDRDVAKMIRQKGIFKGKVRKLAIKKAVELFLINPFDGEFSSGDLLKVLLSIDLIQISDKEKKQLSEVITKVEKGELINEDEWEYDGLKKKFEINLLQLKSELLQDEMTPYLGAKEKIEIALQNVAQMNQIVGSEWKEQAFKDYLEAYQQFNPTWDEFFKLLETGNDLFQEYKSWKKTEMSKDE